MTDPSEPLHPAELDLLRVATRGMEDALLGEVLDIADLGVGAAIGILTNGMIVFGSIASPLVPAAGIDRLRGLVLANAKRPEEIPEEDWDEVLERYAEASTRGVKEQQERSREIDAEVEAADGESFEELPGDLQRRTLRKVRRSAINLERVSILAASKLPPTKLPWLRVRLDCVNAWWVPEVREDGGATLSAWGG